VECPPDHKYRPLVGSSPFDIPELLLGPVPPTTASAALARCPDLEEVVSAYADVFRDDLWKVDTIS
jgi:hypothetical protein